MRCLHEVITMPSKKDLKLNEFGISLLAYRELKYFCLQYEEKKMEISSLLGCKGVSYDKSSVQGGVSDPTGYTAQRIIKLSNDIELIENTIKEVGEDIYSYLLANIAHNTPYETLNVPCGRRQFFETRRKFFYLLNLKKRTPKYL